MNRLLIAALLPGCAAAPAPAPAQDHAGHMDHAMPAMPQATPAEPPPPEPHADHAMHPGPPSAPAATPSASPPASPSDHAADAFYDPARMAAARKTLHAENGGMAFHMVTLDIAELQMRRGGDGYRWQGEAWAGGDIHRATLKYAGSGTLSGALEEAEVQALYSRAIGPWWNLQAGLRHDFRPGPARSYATIGVEGLAPLWFRVEGAAFLSDKGEAHLRAEASYDQRLAQRLILQPRMEANFAFQRVPDLRLGSGFTDIEAGLRLRYEVRREFAPYIGMEWERRLGATARMARSTGERRSTVSFVTGVRFWF